MRVPGAPGWSQFFAPVMLFSLLRLLPRAINHRWTVWLKDRALVGLALAVAVISGAGSEAVHIAALALAAGGLVASSLQSRITPP